MTVPVIRSLTPSDAHLFHALQGPSLVGRAAFGHRYATVDEGGEYLPEWTWVALRDGVVVARAAWWGGPEDTEPVLLNYFDFAEGEDAAGTELLRRAPWSVEYELIVPPRWRDVPAVRAAASARIAAAEAAGIRAGRSPHHAGACPPGVSAVPCEPPVRWALITSRYQAYDSLGVRRSVS